MVASVHVWKLPAGTSGDHVDIVFDGDQGRPKLYGLCGLAVGDLLPDTEAPAADLVLTTLNGDLLVYDLVLGGAAGVQLGAPLHWSIHDGSLGGCNSILIEDLDGSAPGPELYVASSLGVRKFERTQ